MDKNLKNLKPLHCPEVERLMSERLPLITRHGISLCALVIIIVLVFLLFSEGDIQRLLKDMIVYVVRQSKIGTMPQ